ncbi:MAG: hypothetical protein RBS56_00740 [Candidatus Gracilibacteria bacterium]|jgi:hypothetical protein|nr:hypothetical protein [Candidatus Gracilibacteria bacterium]
MEDSQKKSLAFGLLLAVLIFSGAFYFVFQNYLNKGTLIIEDTSKTSAPFFITERRLGTIECKALPCKIGLFAGQKSLFFQKEGYKDKTQNVKIPLWKTATFSLEMSVEPFMSVSDVKLEPLSNPYRVVTDSLTGFQKLVNVKDPLLKAISFLPNKLTNPRYFLGKNHILILSALQNPTLIDLNSGEKIFLSSVFEKANQVIVSDDGKAFAFENPLTKNIQIFLANEKEEMIQTDISFKNASILFDKSENLLFLSTDYNTDTKLFIGIFYTETKEVEKIWDGDIIDQKVEQLFLTEDGKDLFIKTKSAVYKLSM